MVLNELLACQPTETKVQKNKKKIKKEREVDEVCGKYKSKDIYK